MDNDQRTFMAIAGILPARLTALQSAWVLGCAEHDTPILAAAGILKPLGKPAANSPKFYALVEVERIRSNPKLLDKASAAIQAHWRRKRTAIRGQQNRNFAGGSIGDTTPVFLAASPLANRQKGGS